jgi:hypothetical protein
MARILLKYKTDQQDAYTVRGIRYNGTEGCLTLVQGLSGYTFISIPEEVLPAYVPQADEVDIQVIEIPDSELLAELRKHGECAMVSSETRRKIRERYSIDREFEALRTDDFDYNQFVEDILDEGKEKKDKILGIIEYDTSGPDLPEGP